MRPANFIKFSWFLGLAIVTCIVTTSLTARARRMQLSQDGDKTRASFLGARPKNVPAPDHQTVASSSMKRSSVRFAGGVLEIEADAHVRDSRPGMTFVWGVQIVAAKDKGVVLFRKRYDDQVFSLPEGQDLNPTFRDRLALDLPKGTYLAKISIFLIYPESGLRALDDEKLVEHSRGGTAVSRFVVK